MRKDIIIIITLIICCIISLFILLSHESYAYEESDFKIIKSEFSLDSNIKGIIIEDKQTNIDYLVVKYTIGYGGGVSVTPLYESNRSIQRNRK